MTRVDESQRPAEALVRFRDLEVGVRAGPQALAWLAEFLTPWLEVVPGAAPAGVALHVDAGRFDRLRAAAQPTGLSARDFTRDSPAAPVPLFRTEGGPDGDAEWLLDPTLRTAIGRRGPQRVEIVAARERPAGRLALMRVLRELATAHATRLGLLALHAAAVADAAGVTLFAGARRVGKSSLLVHALGPPGESGARFVANDRVLVDADARAHGVPTIVRLREGALALRPALAREVLSGAYHYPSTWRESRALRAAGAAPEGRPQRWPPGLSAAQLCGLLGVERAAGGPVARVVFPSLDGACDSYRLERIDPERAAAALIGDGLFAGGRHADFFAAAVTPPRDALRARVVALCERVPCYTCALGPRAYAEPAVWPAIAASAAA